MILTDVSVRKLFFEYLDRRLSVEKCLFSCLTELVGQEDVKSIWRPNRSKECRSPDSFFMILTDVSVEMWEKGFLTDKQAVGRGAG